jgi:hypothetical protein
MARRHALAHPRSELEPIIVSFEGADMTTRLTKAQAAAFCQRVRPMLRFLYLCRKRLDTRGFDPHGKLFTIVDKAYNAVHSLHVELHYQSIDHGVAAPRIDEPPAT